MARSTSGLLGTFTGIIGPFECYMLKGVLIIRSRKQKSTKMPSLKQLSSRKKITIINELLSSCTPYVKTGYAWAVQNKRYSAYNAAVAYQVKHAITGTYPDLAINYSQVRLTTGPLSTEGIFAVAVKQGNALHFTWTPVSGYPHGTDHVMLLAYAPTLHRTVYNLCGAKRNTGFEILPLPTEFVNAGAIETYLSFMTESGITCTDSMYTGNIKL